MIAKDRETRQAADPVLAPERFPYEIQSRWRVAGRIDDVYAVLTDSESLPRWWPEAYRSVRTIAEGDTNGVGRATAITSRGALPYDVNWQVTVLETEPPRLIRVAAAGDVEGVGAWRLAQKNGSVELVYDWRVRVGKPWMQRFEVLLKPVFVLNHNWVMRRGERGLISELKRRSHVT